MFNILGIQSPIINIPIDRLREHTALKRIERAAPPQKIVTDFVESEETPGKREINYSKKGYREIIHIDDERLQLLHAFQIMSKPVITISPETNLADGWRHFFKSGVRHMPVLSEHNLMVGIVSERDLLARLMIADEVVEKPTRQTISEVMAKQVICASPDTDIRQIARAMFENYIGTIPIVDDNRFLIGIITRSDILYALIRYGAFKIWA